MNGLPPISSTHAAVKGLFYCSATACHLYINVKGGLCTAHQTLAIVTELRDEIIKLKNEVHELKYAPGLTGFVEAEQQFRDHSKDIL